MKSNTDRCDRCKELEPRKDDIDEPLYLCRECIELRKREKAMRDKLQDFILIHRNMGVNFTITFENGYTFSMCIGTIAHDDSSTTTGEDAIKISSPNIECAVLDEKGNFVTTPRNEDDDVMWHVEPNKLLEIMNWAAEQNGTKINS